MINLFALHEYKYFPLIVLLFVFILPSFIFLFFTYGVLGYDSYYFMDYVCNEDTTHYTDQGITFGLVPHFFGLMPCNLFFIKLLLIILYGLSLYAIYLIGNLSKKGGGVFTVLFCAINPILFWTFFKFENDNLAYPFMFLGLFFFLKYIQNKKEKAWLLASLVCLGSGLLFWGAVIYYIFGFLLMEKLIIIIAVPFLLIFFGTIMGQLFAVSVNVGENFPLLGAVYLLFYVFWFKHFRFYYFPLVIYFIIISLINAKFFILGVPIFALFLYDNMTKMPREHKEGLVRFSLFIIIIFTILLSPFYQYPPSYNQHQAVQETIKLSSEIDKKFVNDWGLGHLFFYYGSETNNHSSYGNRFKETDNKLVLTVKDLECDILREYGILKIYNC